MDGPTLTGWLIYCLWSSQTARRNFLWTKAIYIRMYVSDGRGKTGRTTAIVESLEVLAEIFLINALVNIRWSHVNLHRSPRSDIVAMSKPGSSVSKRGTEGFGIMPPCSNAHWSCCYDSWVSYCYDNSSI